MLIGVFEFRTTWYYNWYSNIHICLEFLDLASLYRFRFEWWLSLLNCKFCIFNDSISIATCCTFNLLLMNSFYCAFVFCSDQYIDIYGRDWMEVQNERKQYNLPWDICKYQTMFKQTYLYKWLKCDKSNTQKTKSKLQLIPFFFFSSNDDFEHSKDLAGGVNFHLFMIRFSLQITSEFIRDESKPTGVEMGQLAIWLNKILTKNFLVCFFSKKIKFTFPSNLFQLLFVLFVFYISKHFFFYFEWEGNSHWWFLLFEIAVYSGVSPIEWDMMCFMGSIRLDT